MIAVSRAGSGRVLGSDASRLFVMNWSRVSRLNSWKILKCGFWA
jgi:hypothetical protein